MWWPFRKPQSLGARGERIAARHLRWRGYRILARNVRLGAYEIDILAREGDTIVFVEVKTRRTGDPVPPEENVGPRKREHIRRAARHYWARHGEPGAYYRFDVVAVIVEPGKKPAVRLFRDAFPGA